MNEIGLFIIPIKFDNSIKTYNDYLNLAIDLENYGYTHLFIGEHLTDPREDIQSSIVFAAAILSRTKKIKLCLSVIALPHYNIKLLIKQLEDLYKLGNGRLMLGVGPGALESDANFLGIDHKKRPELFSTKLSQFKKELKISSIFKDFKNKNIFSTILSPFPRKVSNLVENGHSVLSSNFTNFLHYHNHFECISKVSDFDKGESKWHIIYNAIPDEKNKLNTNSISIYEETFEYIYQKLGQKNGNEIMIPNINPNDSSIKLKEILFKNLVKNIDEIKNHQENIYSKNLNGFPIINLFDCISDNYYEQFIKDFPKNYFNC